MTALTPTKPGAVAAAPGSDLRRVAQAVLQVEAEILGIERALSEAVDLMLVAIRPPDGLPPLERERWLLDHLPPEAMVEDLARRFDEEMSAAPNEKANRTLVALLVDAFPQARAEAAVPIEAMLVDLRELRFPPIVVAQALRDLRRSARFVPAISEVLAACNAARQELQRRRDLLDAVTRRRRSAEAEFQRLSRKLPNFTPPNTADPSRAG